MDGWNKKARAAAGGIFGGGLAALTGSTPIGIVMVAAIGAGLAIKAGGRSGAGEVFSQVGPVP